MHPPIEQAVVMLKSAKDKDAARAFLEFVKSEPGRAKLVEYGFTVPSADPNARPSNEQSQTIRSIFQRHSASVDHAIPAPFHSLAVCVSAILFAVGLPLAYWLAYSRWRGKFLVESVVALPLVLPPTVLGFYVLVAMGPRGPLGKLWQAAFGHGLAFTFAGLVFASVLYSLPFAVQPLIASFESIDRKLLDASAVFGAGALRTFFRVILPMSIPGVITALVLSFAHTLGEFGVVLMVGGNLAGMTRTISIDIYDHVQSLEYAEANRLALILLILVCRAIHRVRTESPRRRANVVTVAAEISAVPLSLRVLIERRGGNPPSFVLDVSLEIPSGITILFGPSGAGKSTLLDCIAGLLRPDAGHIEIGDDSAFRLRKHA